MSDLVSTLHLHYLLLFLWDSRMFKNHIFQRTLKCFAEAEIYLHVIILWPFITFLVAQYKRGWDLCSLVSFICVLHLSSLMLIDWAINIKTIKVNTFKQEEFQYTLLTASFSIVPSKFLFTSCFQWKRFSPRKVITTLHLLFFIVLSVGCTYWFSSLSIPIFQPAKYKQEILLLPCWMQLNVLTTMVFPYFVNKCIWYSNCLF